MAIDVVASMDTKFEVIHQAIPSEVTDKALRLLNLEVVHWGLRPSQIIEWHNDKTWFPTLRFHEDILALAQWIPEQYRKGDMAEPQILLHYPDEEMDVPFEFHQDKEPEWAGNRKYTSIVGVALTPSNENNGGLLVSPSDDDEHIPINLDAGDIVVLHPQAWHSGSLNRSGQVRHMVYFRFLEPEE